MKISSGCLRALGRQPWLGWSLAAILAACAPVGPNYQPPPVALPPAWSQPPASTAPPAQVEALGHWWTLFNDPQLDSLIQRAGAGNLDIRVAESRIRQARAQYRLVTATAAPAVGASGAYTNSRRSGNVSGSGSGVTQDLFQAGFDAGWEIDFFGGARRAAEASEARLVAAEENRNDVLVSLEAEVARNYLELRGGQQRLLTARANLAGQEKTLELVRGRSESGLGSQLEVAQAETQAALTRAQLPTLENGIGQAIHSLALLLGLEPQALREELSSPGLLPRPSELLPLTLPSELLRRRPDIRRAERELAAATADIGVATAELFPSFSLTGLVGLQSLNLSELLRASSRYWTVGPTVRWALLDGGRVRANIDLNQARCEEAQSEYQATVLSALGEVENALLALAREEENRQALDAAVTSGQRAVELAHGRYRAGLADFLDVLQGEHALYQSQDQLLQSAQRLAVVRVALFKALGGGWETTGPMSETSPEATVAASASAPSSGESKK